MDDVFVGCLTHQEAFERYVRKCRDTEFLDLVNPHSQAVPAELAHAISWQEKWNAKWEKYVSDFLGHLTAGELHFFVVRPCTNEKVRIMPDDWRGDFWPSRPFMGERIVSASDSQLIKYSDRTPMILERDFDDWLNTKLRDKDVDDQGNTLDVHMKPIAILAGEISNAEIRPPIDMSTAIRWIREHIDSCSSKGIKTTEKFEHDLIKKHYRHLLISREIYRKARHIAVAQTQRKSWLNPGPKTAARKSKKAR